MNCPAKSHGRRQPIRRGVEVGSLDAPLATLAVIERSAVSRRASVVACGSRRRVAQAALGGLFFFAAYGSQSTARAAEPDVKELRHDVALDASLTGVGIAFIVATELLKDTLGPRQCRWCDSDGGGHDVLNPVDLNVRSTLRWKDGSPARQLSNMTAFVVQPILSVGTTALSAAHDDAGKNVPVDLLLVLQAAAVNGVINEVVKFTFARERPFVHALAEEDKPKQEHFSDNNLSFYSGHTSLTFSLAAASGTVASLRNYRLAPLVWATMMPVAALTGYLRIAGDRHYFTDVLAGAVMGTAAGVLVPLLFHGRSGPSDDRSSPSSSGASLAAATTPMAPVVPTVSFGGAF